MLMKISNSLIYLSEYSVYQAGGGIVRQSLTTGNTIFIFIKYTILDRTRPY